LRLERDCKPRQRISLPSQRSDRGTTDGIAVRDGTAPAFCDDRGTIQRRIAIVRDSGSVGIAFRPFRRSGLQFRSRTLWQTCFCRGLEPGCNPANAAGRGRGAGVRLSDQEVGWLNYKCCANSLREGQRVVCLFLPLAIGFSISTLGTKCCRLAAVTPQSDAPP
jgi:hypothetical protein